MTYASPFELGEFAVVAPRLMLEQEATLDWLAVAHAKAAALKDGDELNSEKIDRMRQRLHRFGCKASQVRTRGFDTFDPRVHDFSDDGLYALGRNRSTGTVVGPSSTPLGERSALFIARSEQVLREFYPESLRTIAPDHLVHVTCTGYVSPSAPQRLVDARGWHDQTGVTHAYHMGCYAAFPAIRVAEGLARTLVAERVRAPRVDVVHTELCTLHLNPAVSEPDQMVIHSLFADGHIKYSLRPAGSLRSGFKVLTIAERIVPDSTADMGWTPDHWGFRMHLAREVPRKIGEGIRSFVQHLAAKAGCELGALLKEARFAIHPGGPRIIDAVQQTLELSDEQTVQSKTVLLNRGNMSSATLPHVWTSMLDEGVRAGEKVVSLAFGPGLTIFGAVFTAI